MRRDFRAAMTWLHDWSGLIVGWLLYAMALSGTLSVFRPEIGAWMRPELTARHVDAVEASAAAVRWLSIHAPRSSAWYLEPANERAPYTLALWEQHGAYIQRALAPITGAPDGIRDTLGGDFFYRFHFELQLPYPWGRLIAAIGAMALVLILVTGIIAHRRFFVDFFTFRPGKNQRSWLDAHNLFGVVALPFHLMIAVTGAVTLANLMMPWGVQAAYRSDLGAIAHDLNPASVERTANGRPGRLAPVSPMLREAERRFGEAGLARVTVTSPGDSASIVTVVSATDDRIGIDSHTISFDGVTGKILAEHIEKRPAVRVFDFLYGLHVARFAPIVTRWLYFISGLMLTAVIATGLHLWTIKRQRRQGGFSTALVECMNAGFIAGTPVAFCAFFLASRLLPLQMTHRAEQEVHILFVIWAFVLAAAALRPPQQSWITLLGLSALGCVSVGVIGGWPHDGVGWSVSIVALMLAGGFGFATQRSALRHSGKRRGK